MSPTKKLAHAAGILYLILAISGMIGLMYIPSKMIVENNTAETIHNIRASGFLFRLALLAN